MQKQIKEFYKERFLNLHDSSYTALLSIVQGAVFAVLTSQCHKIWSADGFTLNSEFTFLSFATFLLIVIVWNEYMMGVAVFNWIPNIFDSFLPFIIGIAEIAMIYSLTNFVNWSISMSVFSFLAIFGFINMVYKAQMHDINYPILNKIGKIKYLPLLALPISFIVFYGFSKYPNLSYELSIISSILIAMYLIYSVYYWNLIQKFIS